MSCTIPGVHTPEKKAPPGVYLRVYIQLKEGGNGHTGPYGGTARVAKQLRDEVGETARHDGEQDYPKTGSQVSRSRRSSLFLQSFLYSCGTETREEEGLEVQGQR